MSKIMSSLFLTIVTCLLVSATSSNPADPQAPSAPFVHQSKTLGLDESTELRMNQSEVSPTMQDAHPSMNQAIIYTCPMHPEVRQTSPEECPQCGMTLVEKNSPQEKS